MSNSHTGTTVIVLNILLLAMFERSLCLQYFECCHADMSFSLVLTHCCSEAV